MMNPVKTCLATVLGLAFAAQASAVQVVLNGPAQNNIDTNPASEIALNSATGGIITDLNLSIELMGATEVILTGEFPVFYPDLDISLKHNGTEVVVFSGAGVGDENGEFNVTYDDESLNAYTNSTGSGITGDYQPLNPLSGFDGVNLFGDWTLVIQDNVITAGEDLVAWSITAEVTAVPLPAAAWIFLTGLGGLGLVARKRRS